MRKHTFKKKLLSVTLSALTAFSTGTAAMTTAFYSAPAVYAAGSSLSPQDTKLLKSEEKMMMGMAKEVFKSVPFFGLFADSLDSILDLTDAFGGGDSSAGISREDLEELREHLDEELNEIREEIARLGVDLTNEIKMTYYAGNLGQELVDMHTTSEEIASNTARYKKSSDYPTENDKLVMAAALIGNTNDWSKKDNLVYRIHQIGLLLKGTTYSDLDGKNLYQKVYDYYAKKSLFSGEIYEKAVPYINSIVYEYLYAYSVLAECLEASLKVSRFTPEEEAALSDKVKGEYNKIKSNSASVIEDEIGTEALMMFNFHKEDSLISQYSNFLYNAENNRFTYLNKGTAMKAVKSALGSSEPGSESGVGEIKIGKTNGSTDTNAHSAYKNEKTRLENALSSYNVISCANIGQMGTYVSSNYSNVGSVWNFLKDRGFTYTASDDKTNMLVTNSKVRDDDPFSADGSGYNTYEHRYYLGYSGYVYNNQNLSAEDITAYALVDKKERDKWAYQAITYDHYYSTYVASPVNSKPLKLFYFQDADDFKNTSAFDYDAKTNTLTVTAKATGAVGRQNIRVQYRDNDDDNWTTSYAPTTVITLKDGCTYEVRTIISDEGNHKETTDTQYFSKAKYIEGTEPYIDSNGDYKLGIKPHFEINGRNYAVNDDGSVGEELRDVSLSYFTFQRSGDIYALTQYIGPSDSLTEMVIPKTYEGKKITTIGWDGNPFLSSFLYKSQFVLKLNENVTEIGNFAFGNSQVTKVTGNTSSLKTIGEAAFSGVNKSGGRTLDFEMDYPGEITVSKIAFFNVDVTARIKHATRLSDDGKAKSITYVFTDEHLYGGEPTWKWFDDHKSAQAFFTCTDERCKHYGSVDATVTVYSEGGKIVYKAAAVVGGKTYTTTYTENHTHTYGEPVWSWSDDHSSATATFTCTDERCRHTETVQATVAKDEKSDKTTYTATAVLGGKTYTTTYTEAHTHTYGEPVWSWSDDHSTAKATFTCTDCGHQETVDATITKAEDAEKVTHTATAAFGGKTYTNTFEHTHTYGEPAWNWADNLESATATFTCTDESCKHTETVKAAVLKTMKNDKITYAATVEFGGKTYTSSVSPLKNLSKASADRISEGEKVTIHCLSEGGFGNTVYTVSYSTYGINASPKTWRILQTESENAVIEFKPEGRGEYTFRVEAVNITNSGNRYSDTKIFVVNVGDTFVNTSSIYSKFHPIGEKVYVNCNTQGGVGQQNDTLFSIYYKLSTSDTWKTIAERSHRSGNMYFIPDTIGQYDVRVEAFDVVNNKVVNTVVKEITVIAHKPLINTSTVSDTAYVNEPVTINCSAEGGMEGKTVYTVYYRRFYDNQWTFIQTEGENTAPSFVPLTATKYDIMVYAVNVVPGEEEKLQTLKKFQINVQKGHTHTYGEPTWNWSDDYSTAKATFTCTDESCNHTETMQATVTKTEENGKILYTATAVIDGKTYTDTKESVYYSVTVANIEHGTVTSNKNSALKGETIHLTVTPDDPYKLGTLTVKAANGKSVTVINNSFVMPASDVTISAVFAMKSANIFVGGERITAGNCSDILGNGTASYDFDTNTLTLTNADIEVTNGFGIRYNEGSDKPFNIVLKGTNRIADKIDDGSGICYGIALYAAAPDFIISGTGTLDIEMASGSPRTGIHARKALTIDGTKVSVDVTGSENAIGVDLVYGDSVLKLDNAARMEINASGFALQSNRNVRNLNVDDDCFFEAISAVQAFNRNIDLFDGHPTVTVNTEPSAAGSYNWNESTALTSYKYISLGGQNVLYSVKITETQHGTVTASKESVREGEEVTLTVTPDTGYELTALNIKDDNNSDITVTDNKFIMSSGNVTVSATFTIKKYTVTWKNGDTILETDENVPYGTAPSFDGETPAKAADDNYAYIFTGWSPEISNVTGDVTYTAQFGSKLHTYGEPTWNWSDDHSTAKAIFTCTDCDHQKTIDAEVKKTEDADKVTYTATATFGGKTYTNTYTEEKEATYVYYPAAEPYIDDNGAYILGYKEHYEYKGKYYAVNKDKSVGAEMTDIWVSYFSFTLLPDDTYQINKYTGPTKNLTEMLIPKTFNGKKITTLGTDKMDVFTRSGKPIYTLVLNENITEIKPNAFYSTGVTKVTGNTSGLSKIGDYAFSWVNSANGNTLDITLDYRGMITIGDSIFTHTNVTVRISHATTLSSTKLGALSIKYDFTDAHTYGEPVWNWDLDDFSGANVTRTCTHPNCKHTESVLADFVETTDEDGIPFIEAVAIFDDAEYHDVKPVYTTEVGGYIVEVTGRFKGQIGSGKHNMVGKDGFRVVFKDKNGNKVDAPQYIWVAQESTSDGIVVDPNGDVAFTKEGEFHVQLRSPDGETIYSQWIPVRSFWGSNDKLYEGIDDPIDIPPSPAIPTENDMPKTGDTSSAAAVAAVLLASLSAAMFLSMKRKKDERG